MTKNSRNFIEIMLANIGIIINGDASYNIKVRNQNNILNILNLTLINF